MTPTLTYCGSPISPAEVWDRWNLDPTVIVGLTIAAVLFVLKRNANNIRVDRRSLSFFAGLVPLAIALLSPLCAMAVSLFSARIVDHLVIVALSAPLLALGLFGFRQIATRSSPILAGAAHAGILWAWHLPAAYAAALTSDHVYWLMQGSLLASGVWFWSALLSMRVTPLTYVTTLVAFSAQMGFLGAIIVFAPTPLYEPHFGTTVPWGLTPLEDQQLAGVIMWVVGSIPYLIAALLGTSLWLRPSHATRMHAQ